MSQILQQIEVVEFVAVLENVSLDLRRVDPGDKILHIPRNHERWIRNNFRSHSDVTLLDEFRGGADLIRHLLSCR